jgi:hypothetical protein
MWHITLSNFGYPTVTFFCYWTIRISYIVLANSRNYWTIRYRIKASIYWTIGYRTQKKLSVAHLCCFQVSKIKWALQRSRNWCLMLLIFLSALLFGISVLHRLWRKGCSAQTMPLGRCHNLPDRKLTMRSTPSYFTKRNTGVPRKLLFELHSRE